MSAGASMGMGMGDPDGVEAGDRVSRGDVEARAVDEVRADGDRPPRYDRSATHRELTLDDIVDLRAYERMRDDVRRRVIELKRIRRVQLGTMVSVVFENRETVRFQVQEMARAERMMTDAQIQGELDAYNPLIPRRGELSASLFLEMTAAEDLRVWLPRLVGIERAIELVIGAESDTHHVMSVPEAEHEAALTRENMTASVHYIKFELGTALVDAFAAGPIVLQSVHPEYRAATPLGEETKASLFLDLRDS